MTRPCPFRSHAGAAVKASALEKSANAYGSYSRVFSVTPEYDPALDESTITK